MHPRWSTLSSSGPGRTAWSRRTCWPTTDGRSPSWRNSPSPAAPCAAPKPCYRGSSPTCSAASIRSPRFRPSSPACTSNSMGCGGAVHRSCWPTPARTVRARSSPVTSTRPPRRWTLSPRATATRGGGCTGSGHACRTRCSGRCSRPSRPCDTACGCSPASERGTPCGSPGWRCCPSAGWATRSSRAPALPRCSAATLCTPISGPTPRAAACSAGCCACSGSPPGFRRRREGRGSLPAP